MLSFSALAFAFLNTQVNAVQSSGDSQAADLRASVADLNARFAGLNQRMSGLSSAVRIASTTANQALLAAAASGSSSSSSSEEEENDLEGSSFLSSCSSSCDGIKEEVVKSVVLEVGKIFPTKGDLARIETECEEKVTELERNFVSKADYDKLLERLEILERGQTGTGQGQTGDDFERELTKLEDRVNGKLAEVDFDVETLRMTVDMLKVAVTQSKVVEDAQNAMIVDIKTDLGAFREELMEQGQRLDRQDMKLNSLMEAINEMQLTTGAGQDEGCCGQVSQLLERVEKTEESYKNLNEVQQSILGDISDVFFRLNNFEGEVDGLKTRVSSNEGGLERLEQFRLDTIDVLNDHGRKLQEFSDSTKKQLLFLQNQSAELCSTLTEVTSLNDDSTTGSEITAFIRTFKEIEDPQCSVSDTYLV